MIRPSIFFFSCVAFSTAAALTGSALAGDVAALCDHIAAHPLDPDKPAEVKGVFEITESTASQIMIGIKPSNGIAHDICETAAKVYATEPLHPRCCGSFAHLYPKRRFQFQLGRTFEFEGRFEEAMAAYRKAADAGSSAAMVGIGILYADGKGVKQDAAEAKVWFEKAAALNHAGAFTMLGHDAEEGIEGKKDVIAAVGLYRRGAVLGDDVAKDELKRLNCSLMPPDVDGYTNGKDCTDGAH